MMFNRKKDSTVREDRHGRVPGGRIGSPRTTTAFACAATIALAIVALMHAGQVGAVAHWAGDSELGVPYPTEAAHSADLGPESATARLADGVLEFPELSHALSPGGCGSVAPTTGLGESTYATPPLPHECPDSVIVQKRDHLGCFLNIFGDNRRCKFPLKCYLEREFQRSVSITVGSGDFKRETTETEDMCGYGDCGDVNVAAVPK